MLTKTETSGLRDILSYVNDNDIFSLLETVTNRMLISQNREEAIGKILSCIEKPSDLLKRQKLTKAILYRYLIENRISVSSNALKSTLVKMCLQKWCSSDICKESDYSDVEMTDMQPDSEDIIVNMGIEFSKWFFNIFNNLKEFGPEHFWLDCNLQAELKYVSNCDKISVCGSYNVAAFLSSLITIHKFYFDAYKGSVHSEQEHHGLVKIIISGVLHQHSNCIGLFDSSFGLVRNPACQDTWKIKHMDLKLHVTADMKASHLIHSVPTCQTLQ